MNKLQTIPFAASPTARSTLDPRFSFDRRSVRRSRGFLDHAELAAMLNASGLQEGDTGGDGSMIQFPAPAARLQGKGFIRAEDSAEAMDAAETRSRQDRKAHVTRILSKASAAGRADPAIPSFGTMKSLFRMSDADLQKLEDELDFFAFTGIRGDRIPQVLPVADAGGDNEKAPPERGFWGRLGQRLTFRRRP